MGLSVSPAIKQNSINRAPGEVPDRKHHLAIMDDCLAPSKTYDHLHNLVTLLKALISNWLKISPEKFKLLRNRLTYAEHILLIENIVSWIISLRSGFDIIIKLKELKNPEDCKHFSGMVTIKEYFWNILTSVLQSITWHVKAWHFIGKRNIRRKLMKSRKITIIHGFGDA